MSDAAKVIQKERCGKIVRKGCFSRGVLLNGDAAKLGRKGCLVEATGKVGSSKKLPGKDDPAKLVQEGRKGSSVVFRKERSGATSLTFLERSAA